MIDKTKMDKITEWLIDNVFRNDYIETTYNRYLDYKYVDGSYEVNKGINIDLVDIIASLHNLLYECVTGERYDYMFHWTNKIGAPDPIDDIFDIFDIFDKEEEDGTKG